MTTPARQFSDLPEDTLVDTLTYLTMNQVAVVQRVNRRFHRAGVHPELWRRSLDAILPRWRGIPHLLTLHALDASRYVLANLVFITSNNPHPHTLPSSVPIFTTMQEALLHCPQRSLLSLGAGAHGRPRDAVEVQRSVTIVAHDQCGLNSPLLIMNGANVTVFGVSLLHVSVVDAGARLHSCSIHISKFVNAIGTSEDCTFEETVLVQRNSTTTLHRCTARKGIQIYDASPTVSECCVKGCSGAGIYLSGATTNATIRHCDVCQNVGSNIAICEGAMVTLQRNEIWGGQDSGIMVYDGANALIEDNDIHHNHGPNISIECPASATIISNNRIRKSSNAGVLLCGGATVLLEHNHITHNGTNNVAIMDGSIATLRKNTIQFAKIAGVSAYNGGRGILLHNTISDCNTNVHVTGADSSISMQCNIIRDAANAGIFFSAKSTGEAYRNLIKGSQGANVSVNQGANPTFRENRITSGYNAGVYVHHGGRGTFQRNVIGFHQGPNVQIATLGDPVIRDNYINDSDDVGVRVGSYARGTVTGNEFFNNKRSDLVVLDETSTPHDLSSNRFLDYPSAALVTATTIPSSSDSSDDEPPQLIMGN